jgi:hypothetical protein
MSKEYVSEPLKSEQHSLRVTNDEVPSGGNIISPCLREIIFHIGPHKTATTYIQKMFVENRNSLAKKGIYYPDEGIASEYGHHQIVKEFKMQEFSPSLALALKYTQFHTIIFSSENFDRFRQLQVEALKNALPKGVKVTFIYFIRRPNELLISNWQENIKHGSTKLWSEFFLEHTLHPYSSPLLNHVLVLKHYGNVFGYKNIRLIDYNYLKDSKIDVFSFLMSSFGFPMPEERNFLGKPINNSLPYADAEIIRAFNSICENRLGDSTILAKNPKIRSTDAFKVEMKELEKIVSFRSVDVALNKLNFEIEMRKFFQHKLVDCIWLTPSAEIDEKTHYQLPAASWILHDNAAHHLEKMYKLVPGTGEEKAIEING